MVLAIFYCVKGIITITNTSELGKYIVYRGWYKGVPLFTAFSYCSLTALFYWTDMALCYWFPLSNSSLIQTFQL
ncbi:hypothetical protein T11_1914 [Trichinella zimbabwensis]|uniref:Uncharacterized protein n=1 Tax=Trichinella zimbabwensis TaxID=268475 RepID=A0A0V1GK24_9BILA|nr:hypothetical protein T11_12502 [Trichinella zimbabwensis]KRY98619.1 hypothetical protein T11_1914 [Trichinella zimbabwensis]